ncbi:MAG: gliding motility lipoprotein GldH [Prevotellaceae bacterium]|jgi:gliding motility-associated lipoprotein GldH|nr:gliding motility lipoprotein GldH [Prevotellaceae bacterium]
MYRKVEQINHLEKGNSKGGNQNVKKKIKTMKNNFFAVACIILLFASCSDNSIYRQIKPIAVEGWHKDSIMQFVVPVVDTISEFDIYIHVRNTNAYPLQNLYLFLKTTSPRGISVTDTINLLVADDYGRWTGKSISRIWENKFLYLENIKFANSGNYIFDIQQGMRYDILNGISDAGIEIKYKDLK